MALTAQQIITLACQIAKVPNFTSQAGQFLNVVLQELAQDYDFQVAQRTFRFNFNPGLAATVGNAVQGSGPYPLPADYLRACPGGVFWTLLGVPYSLIPVDLSEFDMAVQQAGLQSYPYFFCTDLSVSDEADQGQTTPIAFVYPPPSGAFPVTVRYQSQPPDIVTPETSSVVPWFPNTDYLIKRTAGELMAIADDTRAETFLERAREILKSYLQMKDDKENRAQTVKLDRRRFGSNFDRLPNTKTIGW